MGKREMTRMSPSFLRISSECAGVIDRRRSEGGQVCGMGQEERSRCNLASVNGKMIEGRHCQ